MRTILRKQFSNRQMKRETFVYHTLLKYRNDFSYSTYINSTSMYSFKNNIIKYNLYIIYRETNYKQVQTLLNYR